MRISVLPPALHLPDDQILVNPDTRYSHAALLHAYPGSSRHRVAAVRISTHPSINRNEVGITAALRQRLDLDSGLQQAWRLDPHPGGPVRIEKIILELISATDPRTAKEALEESVQLPGTLLYAQTGSGIPWEWGGMIFKIREISPARPPLWQFTARTRIEIETTSASGELDLLILADCSGSMLAGDVTPNDPNFQPNRSGVQSKILQAVLSSLASWGAARVMLAGFASHARAVPGFGNSFQALNQQSLAAAFASVRHLEPAPRERTNLTGALEAAGGWLGAQRNGARRVLLLLSDGADPHIVLEEDAGVLTGPTADNPIARLAGLCQATGAQVFAAGISDERAFETYAQQLANLGQPIGIDQFDTVLPNHRLLDTLCETGAGARLDSANPGEIAAQFRRHLGATRLKVRLADVFEEPLPEELPVRTVLAPATDEHPDFILARVQKLVSDCCLVCKGAGLENIFFVSSGQEGKTQAYMKVAQILAQCGGAPIRSGGEARDRINKLYMVGKDYAHPGLRAGDPNPYPVDKVREYFSSPDYRAFALLRIVFTHGEQRDSDTRDRQRAIEAFGLKTLPPDDEVETWVGLWRQCLRKVETFLTKSKEALQEYQNNAI